MAADKLYTFKKHVLADPERIWIGEVASTGVRDQRVLKVRLRDRLPKNFKPSSIDPRFYNDMGITPLGIWALNPSDPRLTAIDKTIRAIRDMIIDTPGIDKFESLSLATMTGLPEDQVSYALYALGQLGRFWSSAGGGGSDSMSHTVITLNGSNDYDEYLAYEELDDLLEHLYIEADPNRRRIVSQFIAEQAETTKPPRQKQPRQSGSTLVTVFDEYTISTKLGEGGAGSVFEAHDESGRAWAIKILDPSKMNSDRRKRFKNEIAFCQSPPSSHIIRIVDSGVIAEANGSHTPFYVMEQYSHSLRKLMERGLTPEKALDYFAQILNGLEAAHSRKIFHRDIKPENILVSDDEAILVIADFGIAHFEEEDLVTAVETRAQDRLANFIYAAPEQTIRGARVDQRADVYALGLILNEMFTNEVPRGMDYKTIGQASPDHGYLDAVVIGMLQQRQESRIASIKELREQIANREKDANLDTQIQLAKSRPPQQSVTEADPLISEPVRVIDFEISGSQLTLILSQGVNLKWIQVLQHLGNYTAIMGKEPQRWSIQGNRASVAARDHELQALVDHFKNWVQTTNQRYAEDRANEHRKREEENQRQRKTEIEELERVQKLRAKIKL